MRTTHNTPRRRRAGAALAPLRPVATLRPVQSDPPALRPVRELRPVVASSPARRPVTALVKRTPQEVGRRRRRLRVPWDIVARALAVLLAVGLTGLAVWAVVALVTAIVAEIAAVVAAVVAWVHQYRGAIILLGIIAVICLFSGGAKCTGMHCGGCRR
ncbi:hypothetical protein [Pseudonocardia sp. Ae505_Ps2]|uniref:hypothetical protein n=1 Tax=Pseudonocardia sp. Ae505_Ps2 TaxID=1885034 RepID=UPI00094E3CFE|nr:hypothetical protein [Pseudonocardia sp. Ae505_Ps2]OLM08321.1 hypothetical protein Ae505Ps2_6225 [Pseudonocardia sp. Ae505_Ps2]